MSENIDCNLSLGVAEAGKIGKDIVVGVLSIEKENEIKLLIHNLLNSEHIVNLIGMPMEAKTKGKNKLDNRLAKKFFASLLRNDSIKMTLFRLEPKEQFKLLQETSILEGKKLYELGKTLDSSNWQYVSKALQLRYQYPKLFVETFLKTVIEYLALNWLIKNKSCGHAELFKKNILDERKMALHIIVNGGPQFSAYQDLLNENLKNYWSEIKTTEGSTFYWNLMVATHGISQANYYYPVVSSIDVITSSFAKNIDSYLYSENYLQEVTAEEILSQKDHLGKSLLEVLHEGYIERTGSTFRPPKLWRIGDFSKLGEYALTLPYLMLRNSIKEKRITAREVDDNIAIIERFYQHNNPLDRDAFIIGEITKKDKPIIELLKELSIEGNYANDEHLIEEYQSLLNELAEYAQSDECIITNEDRKNLLKKIANFEKREFKQLSNLKIPSDILD